MSPAAAATHATMTTSPLRPFVPLLLLGAVACRGALPADYVEEHPPGSGSWRAITGEPAWVKAPPPHAGHVRAVAEAKSNLRNIAVLNLDRAAAKVLGERVLLALRTVVPSPAAQAAADAVPAAMRLVERACRDEVLTHDMVAGNTLATVWGLYEVPIADLLVHVDADLRAAARAALER